jgi:hypothetical protein
VGSTCSINTFSEASPKQLSHYTVDTRLDQATNYKEQQTCTRIPHDWKMLSFSTVAKELKPG